MSTRAELDAHNAGLEAWWALRISQYDLLLRGEALPGTTPAEEAEILLDALLFAASEAYASPFDEGIVISEEARHPDRQRDGLDRLLLLLDAHPPALLALCVESLLEVIATQRSTAADVAAADVAAAPPPVRAAFEAVADAFVRVARADAERAVHRRRAIGGTGTAGAGVEPRPGSGLGGHPERPPATRRSSACSRRSRTTSRGRTGNRRPAKSRSSTGKLLLDRTDVLYVVLAAIRSDRERFQGLYAALRAEPLLPTQFANEVGAFPDLLPADERLLVLYR